jgi:hypothetical protein
MQARRGSAVWTVLLITLGLGGVAPAFAAVDERITYLIETLEESLNYRVRVQSIESLDQIAVTSSGEDLTAIVTAITKTLQDTNALVRYTAASTLVGLARSSLGAADIAPLITKLEGLAEDDDDDVRQLVGDSLPSLRTRLAQLQGATSGGNGSSGTSPQATRFYVAVGPLGDSSDVGRDDLDDLARQYVLEELGATGGVEPHAEIPDADDFAKELERRSLLGFVLQGSVVSMTRSDSQISAVVSILVLDQEQNLRVMLRGNGSAQRRSGTLTDGEVPAMQADALRAAVHAAVVSLGGYLRGL